MYNSLEPASFQSWIDTNSASFKSTEFVWKEVLIESARFRYVHYSFTYKRHISCGETHLVHSFTSEPRNVQRTIQCEASALSFRNWKHDSWVWHTKWARYHDAVDDLSCKQRCANIVAIKMLKNCKSAQTKAQYYGIQKTTSERSEWFHKNKFDIMMAWMTPVSLHFSDVPTGSNNLNRHIKWYRQSKDGSSTFTSEPRKEVKR